MQLILVFLLIACMFVLIQIAQSFKLKPYPGVKLQPVLRTVLTPGEQVPVCFVDRN